MERKYKYYMLCKDLSKTTPFLRADGSPVITTALSEKEAWGKFETQLEARLVTPEYLCEVDLVPIKPEEDSKGTEEPPKTADSNLELETALEGLKNVLRDQGRLSKKNF